LHNIPSIYDVAKGAIFPQTPYLFTSTQVPAVAGHAGWLGWCIL